ncbi:hypothetical protein HanIR_Chr08g0384461 [Helianthus annuus]|nr:hypothetical protein HanIR_Chr08g0384461 [Helianthus annuus]
MWNSCVFNFHSLSEPLSYGWLIHPTRDFIFILTSHHIATPLILDPNHSTSCGASKKRLRKVTCSSDFRYETHKVIFFFKYDQRRLFVSEGER